MGFARSFGRANHVQNQVQLNRSPDEVSSLGNLFLPSRTSPVFSDEDSLSSALELKVPSSPHPRLRRPFLAEATSPVNSNKNEGKEIQCCYCRVNAHPVGAEELARRVKRQAGLSVAETGDRVTRSRLSCTVVATARNRINWLVHSRSLASLEQATLILWLLGPKILRE
ncbi:hypothetical protein GQ53DRAFT_313721 [Thozetella sp. PMI_491]|nr:hypothetical protein GQ53DRAFT_313721 [Thozetella sp. PMI_491]